MDLYLFDPLAHDVFDADFESMLNLRHLFKLRSSLQVNTGLLVHVSDALTSPALVVPRNHRGVMLMHAHDSPGAGHTTVKATLALKQVACWPQKQEDVADYIKGFLVRCQCQPSNHIKFTGKAYRTYASQTDHRLQKI